MLVQSVGFLLLAGTPSVDGQRLSWDSPINVSYWNSFKRCFLLGSTKKWKTSVFTKELSYGKTVAVLEYSLCIQWCLKWSVQLEAFCTGILIKRFFFWATGTWAMSPVLVLEKWCWAVGFDLFLGFFESIASWLPTISSDTVCGAPYAGLQPSETLLVLNAWIFFLESNIFRD